ncbi:MAG: hypothetical protein Q7S13_06995 [Candidatus Omnitrophota bacterium]|nr:hypothetical protein [Candidatus Omnitrophota bacterium]
MLTIIILLTTLGIAAVYPLCFWLNWREPLKQKFHRFHIGLPTMLAGVLGVFVLRDNFSENFKIIFGVWFFSLIWTTAYSWDKEFLRAKFTLFPCLFGSYLLAAVVQQIPPLQSSPLGFFMVLLSSLIICSSLYAMNLGHWYLNVHGLPLKHLIRATYALWGFLALRLAFDIAAILSQTIMFQGEQVALGRFIPTLDGFFLLVALFFGTIFPFVSLFFVKEILKLKNTQAATGVLYVILASILLGDMAYKYYLIKFGIVL